MNVNRGEIVLAQFPHADGGSTRRPVLVIQSDVYNQRIRNTVVAEITKNLSRVGDPAHHLIDISTPDGKQSGLRRDSVVSCNNLATIRQERVEKVIGSISDALMKQIDDCLKAALGIP